MGNVLFQPRIQEGSAKEKIGTNACLKYMGKKDICPGPENADAPGVSTQPLWRPIAIMFYYLDRNFRQYRGIACAMSPQWGQGRRKGDK
jgi:hypothetical protein